MAGLLIVLGLAGPQAHAAPCPGPVLRFVPLAVGVWLVPAASGESDVHNRGQVSNLVLARQGKRLWALGSGPSPAFGRTLACQARRHLGRAVTDVVSPWARPELVLGVGGLGPPPAVAGRRAPAGPLPAALPRHWAHTAVAQAMAEQCPHCVERLRLRLGAAAADLGDDPIHLPVHLLAGEQGRLGPFQWWRLPRADNRWVTVWRLQHTPLWVAHGLLNGSGPPDGRDADLGLMLQASRRLAALAAPDGPAARFVGEQGPVQDSGAAVRHADYWARLLATATAAVGRGDDETAPAPGWPGLDDLGHPGESWAQHPWHSFNWQRAWRQVEPQVLAAPPR